MYIYYTAGLCGHTTDFFRVITIVFDMESKTVIKKEVSF